MDKILDGRVVAITGAGGGLGRAYALYLARLGARLVINDVGGDVEGTGSDAAIADQVAQEVRASGGQAVTNHASVATMEGGASVVRSAVESFGRLDVLINNAGILRDKSLLKMTEQMWDPVIAVHLKGTFACTLAAATQMKEQGSGGSIINTTSFAGLKGNFGQTNYGAAKAGIYGMTLVQAVELARFDIRVNAIAPLAKTRMTEGIDLVPDHMTVEHVAPVVAYLASDLSAGFTGRVLGVHGGHIFEYRMITTDGVEAEAWTPEQIRQRLPEIVGEVAASGAPAPAAAAPEATGAPAAAPAPAPAAPETPQDQVRATFKFMPAGFVPERARGFNAVFHWEVAGTGDFTITIADGTCTSAEGKVGEPTCVVKTDTETFIGITEGTIDGTQAYMQGKIAGTNVGALMKYQKAIDPRKARAAFEASLAAPAAAPAAEAPPAAAPAAEPDPLQGIDPSQGLRLLLGLVPHLGRDLPGPQRVCLQLSAGDLRCTVTRAGGELSLQGGHAGEPTSRLVATPEALWELLCGGDGRESMARAEITTDSMAELRWLVACCGEDPRGALAGELRARGPGIDRKHLGAWYHGDPRVVTEEQVLQFARATNDPNPRFVDTSREGGVEAPPLMPVRYFNELWAKVVTDPALGVDVSRLLFGEMELRSLRPVRPGDVVAAKAMILALEDKDTGQVMRVLTRLMSEGEPSAEAVASFFIRWEETLIQPIRTPAPPAAAPGAVAFEEPMQIREDQTPDFAEASQDPNPVHLDEQFARSVGMPGIIVHGLCNMAFCGRAFVERVCGSDPGRLELLKVRFSRPARPGQTLTTRAFEPTLEHGTQVFAFEAVNDEGETIITEGIARCRPDSGRTHA